MKYLLAVLLMIPLTGEAKFVKGYIKKSGKYVNPYLRDRVSKAPKYHKSGILQ